MARGVKGRENNTGEVEASPETLAEALIEFFAPAQQRT